MTRKPRFVAFVVLIAATTMTVLDVDRVDAECRTSEVTRQTTCRLTHPSLPARAIPVGDGRISFFEWMSLPFPLDPETRARSDYCSRTTVDGATSTVEFGNTYVVWLRNATTRVQVTAPKMVCTFDDANDPQLDPPPPPPTEAEFVEAARKVVTVQSSLNPRVEIGGLTGLDTWLWCVDPDEVTVGVALRGWTASATLNPVEFAWAVDGTASARFRSGSCGSEADPAASWMPETKGPYTVTLTSTWAGMWTLAYNGFPAGVFPLGPYDFAAPTINYPVDEYRGSLTPPDSEAP